MLSYYRGTGYLVQDGKEKKDVCKSEYIEKNKKYYISKINIKSISHHTSITPAPNTLNVNHTVKSAPRAGG